MKIGGSFSLPCLRHGDRGFWPTLRASQPRWSAPLNPSKNRHPIQPISLAGRSVLGFVGSLLILYAVMMPLLAVVGERTTGEITVVRREVGDRRDPKANRYSYSVGFEFVLDDGRIVPGNTKVIGSANVAGISKGPCAVRYLAIFPYINALEMDTRLDLGKFAMLAAGLLLGGVAVLAPSRRKSKAEA